MSTYYEDLEEALNATADEDLGTVVSVLDGQGQYEWASVLELCRLWYDVVRDNWSPQQVEVTLLADPLLLGTVTPDIVNAALPVIESLLPDHSISSIRVAPRRVAENWRQARQAGRLLDDGPSNQASYRSLPEKHPTRDSLKFHNEGEAAVYDAFIRAQARRPAHATLAVMPGPGARVVGRTFVPDLVVAHRGRVAAVEVDGPHHRGRAAADQSRDRLLQDAGFLFVERVVVEDTSDAKELDAFVENFLSRLVLR